MQAFSKIKHDSFSEQTRRANLSERVATTAPNIQWAHLIRAKKYESTEATKKKKNLH
jgi:hypothetical protein